MITPMATTPGLNNLVYMFIMVFPEYSADRIYREWKSNKVLKEYRRPPLQRIKSWWIDTHLDLKKKRIYFRYGNSN